MRVYGPREPRLMKTALVAPDRLRMACSPEGVPAPLNVWTRPARLTPLMSVKLQSYHPATVPDPQVVAGERPGVQPEIFDVEPTTSHLPADQYLFLITRS